MLFTSIEYRYRSRGNLIEINSLQCQQNLIGCLAIKAAYL